MHAVLDTNVLVSALKSQSGASFEVLRQIRAGSIRIAVTVPLLVEYESVLLRPGLVPAFSAVQIQSILNTLAALAWHQEVYYLWRPCLDDPKDEMVLEAALAARMNYIITHNVRDFVPAGATGIQIVTPAQALQLLQKP